MSDRIWQFRGKLQENDKRVITEAEGTVSEIVKGESPRLDIKSNNGKLVIDLKLPAAANDGIGGVGKQFTVDGLSTNLLGQKYGEIFNDYENNTANGIYSHVAGVRNNAAYSYQTVFGKYNDNKENNVFEIGYGDDNNNRTNIFEINKEGIATIVTDIGNKRGISLESLQKNKLEASEFDYLVGESQARILTYVNEETKIIGANEELIISIEFLTTDSTSPMFFASIPFELSADALVTFTYYLDNNLFSDDTLEQNFSAGKHFVTLFNTFNAKSNFAGSFKVKMKVSTGTATITEYKLRSALYVQGVGITAAWNGKINLVQKFTNFDFNEEISILPVKDNADVSYHIPIPGAIEQQFNTFSIDSKINILGIADSVDNIDISFRILTWIFKTLYHLKYIYNSQNVLIENESFKLRQDYSDDYEDCLLTFVNGKGVYLDIDISNFSNVSDISDINIVQSSEKFIKPNDIEYNTVFSYTQENNIYNNQYVENNNNLKLKTNYNENDYQQNKLNIDKGLGAVIDLPLSLYKKVNDVNIINTIITKERITNPDIFNHGGCYRT